LRQPSWLILKGHEDASGHHLQLGAEYQTDDQWARKTKAGFATSLRIQAWIVRLRHILRQINVNLQNKSCQYEFFPIQSSNEKAG